MNLNITATQQEIEHIHTGIVSNRYPMDDEDLVDDCDCDDDDCFDCVGYQVYMDFVDQFRAAVKCKMPKNRIRNRRKNVK